VIDAISYTYRKPLDLDVMLEISASKVQETTEEGINNRI